MPTWLHRFRRSEPTVESLVNGPASPMVDERPLFVADPESFVNLAYNAVFRRNPDPAGFQYYSTRLASGEYSRDWLLDVMTGSEEFRLNILYKELTDSLHAGRMAFVKSLPRGRMILDLGGVSRETRSGAFFALGYPYHFERLVIIDLPPKDRHETYADVYQPAAVADGEVVETPLGPVEYLFRPMTQLDDLPDSCFDLVYSGQSIEHITEDEGEIVCREVRRILRPGGYFCVDTPNARATRLQQEEFIDADHKIEYTHDQLLAKFERAGLVVKEAKGINYLAECFERGEFDARSVAWNYGLYGAIEDCYLLAYVCQRPTSAS